MNNNHSSKNSISHKDLQAFLINAKKDITSIDSVAKNKKNEEEKKFNDLIKTWTETSQKILLMMNKEQKILTENKNPKSLMAFGAMGVHINMALQALKSIGSDL